MFLFPFFVSPFTPNFCLKIFKDCCEVSSVLWYSKPCLAMLLAYTFYVSTVSRGVRLSLFIQKLWCQTSRGTSVWQHLKLNIFSNGLLLLLLLCGSSWRSLVYRWLDCLEHGARVWRTIWVSVTEEAELKEAIVTFDEDKEVFFEERM